MDAEQFRKHGKDMVDFIADYLSQIRTRDVVPSVEPGYLRALIPDSPPQQPEPFETVMADLEKVIMPGVTHWHHPQFHAYYPTANSFPALLGDMLSDAIACIGFSWIASPACTELEVITLDWLVQALGLPEHFLSTSELGGGVIQGTASEASLIVLLAARSKVIREIREVNPEESIGAIIDRLVVYGSKQSHSSIDRACSMALVKFRHLDTDIKRSAGASQLQSFILEDRAKGLIPLLCYATLGTTSSCAFDDVEAIGEVCQKEKLWLHVDAAYAGSAFLCPEFRHLSKGMQFADSFNFNPHKWMNVTFDCSALWLRNKDYIVDAFNVDPVYLKHDHTGLPDYRHWQIPLGRRFRSLKLWFVIRTFGISGLQERIRKDVALAHAFEALLKKDEMFEIPADVILGLVCFRLKGPNSKTEQLYENIKADKRLFLVPSKFEDDNLFFLRLAICSYQIEERDIQFAYDVIKELSSNIK